MIRPDAVSGVRLADPPAGPARTTAALVASLRDRLRALRAMTGADAVGSVIAGYAALGRAAARSADGRRLAEALRAGRAGSNGEAIWSALGIDAMASTPASPVLDHLRNDVALLLADDLDAALADAASPTAPGVSGSAAGSHRADPVPAPDSVDYLVGMWAAARELVALVETLAARTTRPPGSVAPAYRDAPVDGPLLR